MTVRNHSALFESFDMSSLNKEMQEMYRSLSDPTWRQFFIQDYVNFVDYWKKSKKLLPRMMGELLIEACSTGHMDVVKTVTDRITYSAMRFIFSQRNVFSPLHCAVACDYRDIVNHLVELGADVCLRDGQFFAPLHHAVFNNNLAIAELLLENGAYVDVKDSHKLTPHEIAKNYGYLDMMGLLERYGAKLL